MVGSSNGTASQQGFSFAVSGDLGIVSDSGTSFNGLPGSGASFLLTLGDLSYNGTGTEPSFCNYVKSHVGPKFPVELVGGNHEEDSRVDGFIDNFARCLPDQLGATGTYGKEYYFDYPSSAPLARIIMIAADLRIDGEYYNYSPGKPHYTWLSSTIDNARAAGIPWIIVGMHKNCITIGKQPCEIGSDLINLLTTKRIDLVFQGHDHNYQRSKQLTCISPASRTVQSSYLPSCIADNGASGNYQAGNGTVIIVSGFFGGGIFEPLRFNDPDAGYFARAMGGSMTVLNSTMTGTGRGYTQVRISPDRIDSHVIITHQLTPGSVFTDDFSIIKKTVTVPPPPQLINHPPIINPIPNVTVNASQNVFFRVEVSDPDSNHVLVSAWDLPSNATFNQTSRTFSWTPTPNQTGNFTVTFTATDDGTPRMSSSTTVLLQVKDWSVPPVIDPVPDQTMMIGSILTIHVRAHEQSPVLRSLVFYLDDDSPEGMNITSDGLLTWIPKVSAAGGYTVRIFVSDGVNTSSTIIRIRVLEAAGSGGTNDNGIGRDTSQPNPQPATVGSSSMPILKIVTDLVIPVIVALISLFAITAFLLRRENRRGRESGSQEFEVTDRRSGLVLG